MKKPAIEYTTVRTKPLSELRAGDVPRGLDPDDVALPDPSPSPYEITTDGRIVWVNGPTGAIGRFGVNGIDVHNAENTACVCCTHEVTTSLEWDLFVQKMREVHGVKVPARYKPKRFR